MHLPIMLAVGICCASTRGFADESPSHFWLTADYTYTQFTYKEPSVMTEKARFAGVRGEFGLRLFSGLAFSAGGEYQDGHTDYDGSTFGGTAVKVITNDYLRQTQYLAHLSYGSMSVAAGLANRYWYNDLVISYRRRTEYSYVPIFLTYRGGPIYLKVERDIWKKGRNKSHMSDVNPSANDVEFTLGKGQGIGAEIGYIIPGVLNTRLFVSYHKWTVEQSDIQSDGTQNLVEPKNETTEVKAGIGLLF